MGKKFKEAAARTLYDYRKRLIFISALGLFQLLFGLLKRSRELMNFMTDHVTHPIRGILARACAFTVWSVAEWLLISAALFAVAFLLAFIIELIKQIRKPARVLFRYLSSATAIALAVLSLMTLLWNVNYYADNFQENSGVFVRESSVDELYRTTLLFADKLNADSVLIKRDENLLFCEDTGAAFDLSKTVFRGIESEYAFLKGPELRSKKVFFSKALSEIRTTGVAFPFTGEANINIDQPAAWIPVTIAHEIAHQRRIASEQEANFVAVLACELSDDAAYRYSGNLLAYNYLAGALASEDRKSFLAIAETLDEGVNADLRHNYEYWRQFESKVSEVSDNLYDDYLKSQGQAMGTKSYGAVVDMLIAYYCP